jgi:monoamine oxidase
MTLDASPRSGVPGVLAAFGFRPFARTLGALDPNERRRFVLDAIVTRFGPSVRQNGSSYITETLRIDPAGMLCTSSARSTAARPVHYEEIDWAEERWPRGCFMAHMPPGVITQFGRALRAPVGHPLGRQRDGHRVAREHRRGDPLG